MYFCNEMEKRRCVYCSQINIDLILPSLIEAILIQLLFSTNYIGYHKNNAMW